MVEIKNDKRSYKMLISRIVVIIIFMLTLMIMRVYEPEFLLYSKGTDMLDMKFRYSSDDAYQLFRVLGIEGRLLYIRLLCIDFIFIISFTIIQNYLLKWAIGKENLYSKWRYWLSISYLRGLFDFIENILILTLILLFPKEIGQIVTVSSFATLLKFVALGLWLIIIPISLFVKITKKKKYIKYN